MDFRALDTNESLMISQYKGWHLKAFKHVVYPPYKDYCCSARRDVGNRTFMFYTEGVSIKQAVSVAKDKIDTKDTCTEWDTKIQLTPCHFV
jgi:hypothetical protein